LFKDVAIPEGGETTGKGIEEHGATYEYPVAEDLYMEVDFPNDAFGQVNQILDSISSDDWLLGKYKGVDKEGLFLFARSIIDQDDIVCFQPCFESKSRIDIDYGMGNETKYFIVPKNNSSDRPNFIWVVTVDKDSKDVHNISFGGIYGMDITNVTTFFDIDRWPRKGTRLTFSKWLLNERLHLNSRGRQDYFEWVPGEE
jgi:hypothetical protein